MSIYPIQGQLLEVTVVGCNKLKDTEWFSRQDPYVIVEYGSTKNRTRTCTDGGRKPTFQEKFCFTLIEGLREINVAVWNSNTLTFDDFIGSGKVQLQKVLSQGYDDSSWTIQSKTGRYAGEVKLIMHYAKANVNNVVLLQQPAASYAPSAPYGAPHVSQASMLYAAPPPPAPAPLTSPTYPPTAAPASLSAATYPLAAAQYPSHSPYSSYNPPTTAYPPSPYPLMQPSAYPPSAYPPASVYSSAPYPSPPQPQSSTYPPPGSYPGLYPPPPY